MTSLVALDQLPQPLVFPARARKRQRPMLSRLTVLTPAAAVAFTTRHVAVPLRWASILFGEAVCGMSMTG